MINTFVVFVLLCFFALFYYFFFVFLNINVTASARETTEPVDCEKIIFDMNVESDVLQSQHLFESDIDDIQDIQSSL